MQIPTDFALARRLPAPGCPLDEAERYCRWLATHHYENFTVVTRLLPRRLRQHFYNVYAYCRWADDLGDEVGDPARALELLDGWERELHDCYAGKPSHPVFVALRHTLTSCEIPISPFADLLVAFRQDQTVRRYPTWDRLLEYCRYSANPVGRLVLYLCGYRDAELQQLSDSTCTALQLTNCWQDVSQDLEKDRLYIPREVLTAHGLGEDDLWARRFDDRYVSLMQDMISRTRKFYEQGLRLTERVDPALRVDVEMFSRGGLAVLDAIAASGYDTLRHRPTIPKSKQLRLVMHALWKSFLTRNSAAAPAVSPTAQRPAIGPIPLLAPRSDRVASPSGGEILKSYAECRRVARVAASNFYYAFFMLPQAKRDALCALYAFMRLVDDVSDSVGSPADKQRGLARWRAALDAAVEGDVSAHPILPAFSDTLARFRIPPRYFHDLISGAEMDLTVPGYATFARLCEYCYRVAGTVGLTCLHVFGFEDPRAPDLAEKLGIAFQLTNILRDVPGDYQIGRIYLPQEDLDRFGIRSGDLAHGPLTSALRDLFAFEADRAWSFYREGAPLISRVDSDARGALWALVRIYSGLLGRSEARGYDVFSSRTRVSTSEKTGILLRARLGWYSQDHVLEERDRHRRRFGGAVFGRRAG
jgi:squalene synthase HpnC/squalene synthase HpnD